MSSLMANAVNAMANNSPMPIMEKPYDTGTCLVAMTTVILTRMEPVATNKYKPILTNICHLTAAGEILVK